MSTIDSMITVGKNVRFWRERKGVTQEGLANKAGLHRTTVAKIETDMRHGTNITTLQKIADALGISLNSLLNPLKERR